MKYQIKLKLLKNYIRRDRTHRPMNRMHYILAGYGLLTSLKMHVTFLLLQNTTEFEKVKLKIELTKKCGR